MQNLIGDTIYSRRSKDHMLEPAILIEVLEHEDKEETFIVEFTKDKLRLEVDSIYIDDSCEYTEFNSSIIN